MQDATFRIGFVMNEGYWSGLGTDVLRRDYFPQGSRTMNLGQAFSTEDLFNTALHEIGHCLGFPHEHQNPNAGVPQLEVYTPGCKNPPGGNSLALGCTLYMSKQHPFYC